MIIMTIIITLDGYLAYWLPSLMGSIPFRASRFEHVVKPTARKRLDIYTYIYI